MSIEVPTGIMAAERETVIRWDEDEKLVTIWSFSPTVLRRLHKLGLMLVSESWCRAGGLHGREYRIPLADFRRGLQRRRAFSEAQRQQQRERLLRVRGAVKQTGAVTRTRAGQG